MFIYQFTECAQIDLLWDLGLSSHVGFRGSQVSGWFLRPSGLRLIVILWSHVSSLF